MYPVCVSWIHRAALVCVIADRQDVIKVLVLELVYDLGAMAGDVDSNLLHDGDCFRPDAGCPSTGALDFKLVSAICPKEPLSHLTPGRVCRAENESSFLHLLLRKGGGAN